MPQNKGGTSTAFCSAATHHSPAAQARMKILVDLYVHAHEFLSLPYFKQQHAATRQSDT
jgi:hypothetical protein